MYMIPFKKREGHGDLEQIQQEMNRLFNTSLSRWFDEDRGLMESAWTPAMEMRESKDAIVVIADLPGVAREDIDVSVHGDQLTVKGEKKQEKEEKEQGYVRTERFYGSFMRTVTLPCEVDAARVDASFKDGVLTLAMPKKEEAKPQQIQVKVK